MTASLKAFMEGIVDYAGLFPPADLSLDTALQKYSQYRQSDDSWMLSRFVIPGLRLDELEPYGEQLFRKGAPYEFSVLGRRTETLSEYREHLDELIAFLNKFHDRHGRNVTTDILEIKLPREAVLANDIDLLTEVYNETLQQLDISPQTPNEVFFEGLFEKNWKKEIILILKAMHRHARNVEGRNVRPPAFKIRCGGMEADMVPSLEQLALALNTAREQNVAVKCTAGLHHPVRHYDDSVKTMMHGFFNVFGGAMLSYARDLSNSQLIEILEEEDPDRFRFTDKALRWNDLSVSTHEIAELRDVALISFGSCSFDEPREDLRQLGLL